MDDSKAGMTDKVRECCLLSRDTSPELIKGEKKRYFLCVRTVRQSVVRLVFFGLRSGGGGGYLIWTTFISRSDKNKMKSRCHLLHQASSQFVFIFAGKSSKMILLLLILLFETFSSHFQTFVV